MSSSTVSVTPHLAGEVLPSGEEDDGVNVKTLLPLLEKPDFFEARAYYYDFPSRPSLLGRTSSGKIPWWRLSEEPEDPSLSPYANLRGATVCGPVGPHAIHACWRVSTLNRVRAALDGIPWTSIDVLRYGRAKLQEHERPVIVWVGVDLRFKWATEKSWDLIAFRLRAVRAALDADNLTDVECEMRDSEVLRTVDAGPRLLLPPHDRNPFGIYKGQEELAAFQPVSAAVGQAITPANSNCNGTLGLYLKEESEAGEDSDESGTVWALTCHHVAFPFHVDPTKQPVAMSLPEDLLLDTLEFDVDPHISRLEQSIANHKPLSGETSDSLENSENQRQLKLFQKLRDVLLAFQTSDAARTLGHVHHSPPMRVKHAGTENAFWRDWALVELDRQKFPNGFGFENVVNLINKRYNPKLRNPPLTYRFPCDNLLRLKGTVPVEELLGQSSTSAFANHNGRRNIVMKRGYGTRVSAGIMLDIESVARSYVGGVQEESFELAVVHLARPHDFDSYLARVFSNFGDSGAVVFDVKGRIVGMLTGGAGDDRIDCSYVTPIAKLQSDIEQTLGRRVRII
ncbi:MAG: hypothetical protein SEPTF4163_001830 [Sporothrix epigloea]